MDNKVLFMIIDRQIQYLSNSTMDHREWYNSLGLDPNQFENIVRGFILEHKIVFFKGINFNYDEEVIRSAKIFSPSIREYLGDSTYEVFCGVTIPSGGRKWEPILKIKDEELGFTPEVQQSRESENQLIKPGKPIKDYGKIENGPLLEFKNDYHDDKFVKFAIIITSFTLVLCIILKIILFHQGMLLHWGESEDVLLCFSQVALLGICIVGYLRKRAYTKYAGVFASIAIILTLDFWDLALGIFYFLFSVDQQYIFEILSFFKKLFKKGKDMFKKS